MNYIKNKVMANKFVKKLRLFNGVMEAIYDDDKDFESLKAPILNITSGFTLKSFHINKYIRVGCATDVNVIVNNNEFEVGNTTTFEQTGVGTITFVSDGVSVLNGNVISAGQYKVVQIIKVDSYTWTVIGGTS